VEYDGTLYHGWQLQPGLPTVQGELEKVLWRLSGKLIRVHGAGRTDAGVHALGQVAHFQTDWSGTSDQLQRACNALLPKDVLIRCLEPVHSEFHARHSALSKIYRYRIMNQPLRSCFSRNYAWHIHEYLDADKMNEAANHLLGSHDFAAFGSPTDGTDSTVREIFAARWERERDDSGFLQFTVRGSGFLRHMVRSIVGTLVMVGRGKITQQDLKAILISRDRSNAGQTAPAHGLFLDRVLYREDPSSDQNATACRQYPLTLRGLFV